MSYRSVAVVVVSVFVVTGCRSTPAAPSAEAQAVVEAVAKQHPDCLRLTVHAVPPSGGDYCAVASTHAERLGKASDPEDLAAMKSGKPVVLDEPGAVDVTVPILEKDGKWTATCGVTVRARAGANREQLVANATTIAKTVEASMRHTAMPVKAR